MKAKEQIEQLREQNKTLTIKEVATILKLSIPTVYRHWDKSIDKMNIQQLQAEITTLKSRISSQQEEIEQLTTKLAADNNNLNMHDSKFNKLKRIKA